ncbi:hypothetical protein [Streptomyces gobitricini]|uniref:Uncharacterized protein n=1 Tax=Streptomyces gobitricini TaxID=68211 RepID=A0ABN3LPU7_9ACTN
MSDHLVGGVDPSHRTAVFTSVRTDDGDDACATTARRVDGPDRCDRYGRATGGAERRHGFERR